MKLTKKDKATLKTSAYVFQKGVLTFPKPISFTLKRLKKIIKLCEKIKKKETLVGITIELNLKKLFKKNDRRNKKKIRKSKTHSR